MAYLRGVCPETCSARPATQWPLLLQEAMHIRLLALEDSRPVVALATTGSSSYPAALVEKDTKSQGSAVASPKERAKRRRQEERPSATPASSSARSTPRPKFSTTPIAGGQLTISLLLKNIFRSPAACRLDWQALLHLSRQIRPCEAEYAYST